MTSVGSPSISDGLHSPWYGLVELLQVFGCDCSPSHSSDFFFRPIFWTINLVLLVTFKQIKLEMLGWSHFKDLFRTFPTVTIFSRVHATLQPALSVRRSVCWSVGLSVCHILLFFTILFSDLTAPAHMVW